ncbi:MAG: hypothetical protein CEE43_12115 [Promethearchaeota archaeon Loki_b32]|nr:MAG: hypothetical protein CEE43_12115 [Candidatus Lokiarchaeota archaeon Loki_b32]
MGFHRRLFGFPNKRILKELPPTARKWVKARTVLKPSLFIVAILFSSVVYYLNEASISNVYQGIHFPLENRHFYFNADEPSNSSVNIPYSFQNNGFFELSHIEMNVFFRIEYIVDGEDTTKNAIIFSKGFDLGNLPTGSTLNGSLYGDYHNFRWNNVYQMLDEYDPFRPINIFFDIFIRFSVIAVESDQIMISNLLLGNVTQLVSSARGVSMYSYTPQIFQTSRVESKYISSTRYFISILIILFIISSLSIFIKKNKKNAKVRITLKKHKKSLKQRDTTELYKLLIRIAVYLSVILMIIFLLLSNLELFNKQHQDLGKEFINRHEMITYISITTISIISITRLISLVKKDVFRKNLLIKSIIPLITSSVLLISIIFWALNSVIIYEIDENTIILRNTFAMYIPLIVIYIADVVVNFFDTIHFHIYKLHYMRIRNKEERKRKFIIPKSKHDFNVFIFKAIRSIIESNNKPSSISQIKSYFEKNNISKISKSKDKVNSTYMNTLVDYQYLQRSKQISNNVSYYVYYLTPKAEKYLDDKDETYQEPIKVTSEKTIIDDEQLVACPSCEYYCRQEWETCPICGALILSSNKVTVKKVKKDKKEATVNVYCISCGTVNKEKNTDFLCSKCSSHIKLKYKFTHCPSCGEKTLKNTRFCISCYRSFNISSFNPFKNYSEGDLYIESIKNTRNIRLLIIGLIQVCLLLLLIREVMTIFHKVVVIEIYDFIYIVWIFIFFLIMNRLKYHYLRKRRLIKDDNYKTLLTLIHVKNEDNQISVHTFKLFQNFFKTEEKKIENILNQIKIIDKLRSIIFLIIIAFGGLSIFAMITRNIILTFSLWLSITLLLDFIYSGKKTKCINELFRLGSHYNTDDYKEYVKYVLKHLEYTS